MGAVFSYDALPASLKKECLVRTKEEEDPEELKSRQELVKTMKPSKLSQFQGIGDFPLPSRIETLVRPGKRNLKSTKEKELQKRRCQ